MAGSWPRSASPRPSARYGWMSPYVPKVVIRTRTRGKRRTFRRWLSHQESLMYLRSMAGVASVSTARSAAIFQALSDEKRLRILALLAGGELCVCELTEVLAFSQPLLSFPLRTLKDVGLVADRRAGRWVYY